MIFSHRIVIRSAMLYRDSSQKKAIQRMQDSNDLMHEQQ